MEKHFKKYLAVIGLSVVCAVNIFSQEPEKQNEPNRQIKKVYLIFKTHLDIGYTELSSVVERQYIREFIPKTLELIDRLKSEQAEERYVWTTGSWLVWEYLKQAPPEAVKKFETAISQGDIVWNGVPYTVQSEMMSKDLFVTCLKLSQELDRRFGEKTMSAKMTDVPGHTRGIISCLSDAGITLFHIGANSSSPILDMPTICRWKNTDGKEIVLLYQYTYGEDMVLPDGETVVSVNFTGDNHGPHSLQEVKNIYAAARKKYPDAKIVSASFNEVAADIRNMWNRIPVVTSEIGDTWVFGLGSSPMRIARYRELSRLYTQWVQTGKMDMNSLLAIDFAVRLGRVAEHTWGLSVGRYLKNWDKYSMDDFIASRNTQTFRYMEQSWAEEDENIDKAIALLPPDLQKEALKEMEKIVKPVVPNIKTQDRDPQLNEHGAYTMLAGGVETVIGELVYQTYSTDDYTAFHNSFLRIQPEWALISLGKPGLDKTNAKSVTLHANVKNCKVVKNKKSTSIQCSLRFPADEVVDPRVLPESVVIEYTIPKAGHPIEMKVSLINKPAVRLPEAYLLSFIPKGIQSILAEKMGDMVDVSDVVPGGSREIHAIDNYIDLITGKGTVRITSLDAPIVVIGERKMLNYSKQLPDLTKGVHFCLVNNLWGTNFSMWWEGSISYRFIIEVN